MPPGRPMAEPLEETIRTVIELVQLATDRGQGSGMLGLRRQLEALLQEPRPRHRQRASQRESCSSIDLVRSRRPVGPEVREAVVTHVRSSSRVSSPLDDPWMALDPQALAERNHRIARRAADAQRTAVQACGSYGKRGNTRYLRDATNELVAAVQYGRELRFRIPDEESCPALAERLHAALNAALEPSAMHFFTRCVRNVITAHTPVARDGGKRRWNDGGVESQWLSERRWEETGYNEEVAAGRWFVGRLQIDYDEIIKAAKARKAS